MKDIMEIILYIIMAVGGIAGIVLLLIDDGSRDPLRQGGAGA
jgi:hypothetical protein